ncbi:unnamed protein product [Symbiodinium sp. CCMP2456]|nr:unnamed protein product [Symbiodinium sp. CCMP2456]
MALIRVLTELLKSRLSRCLREASVIHCDLQPENSKAEALSSCPSEQSHRHCFSRFAAKMACASYDPKEPDTNSEPTGEALSAGEVIEAVEALSPADDSTGTDELQATSKWPVAGKTARD